jgi:hypothetical protein
MYRYDEKDRTEDRATCKYLELIPSFSLRYKENPSNRATRIIKFLLLSTLKKDISQIEMRSITAC